MCNTRSKPACLVLEDGSVFAGQALGAPGQAGGEVVFNTGMVGYPESLTDPSYRGQILVFTYPLIGNYGVPGRERDESGILRHFESEAIHAAGVVVADPSWEYDHWHASLSFDAWLRQHAISGIWGVDTRALTQALRNAGTMRGRIGPANAATLPDNPPRHLVAEVSTHEPVTYTGHRAGDKTLVLVDCGVKNNIIRAFVQRGFKVKRVPWDHDFTRERADGIILSNGPGDPVDCAATIGHTRRALLGSTPILGICLGSQILGLAAGAKTYKLKYGHRSHNQPCLETGTRRCYITSQNHGYAVDGDTLPQDWRSWFVNANDQSNEGIMHIAKPFFGTQFHPEASPGPDDCEFIFDMFARAVRT
jgi:carbamoyl-phosphate synthase small subunit